MKILQADRQILARAKAGAAAGHFEVLDSPEWREMVRRHAADLDVQVDVLTARLAEIPGPAPGFDTRKARDQQRFDELLAELETFRGLQRDFTEMQLRELEQDLTSSAQRADEAANAFLQALENF